MTLNRWKETSWSSLSRPKNKRVTNRRTDGQTHAFIDSCFVVTKKNEKGEKEWIKSTKTWGKERNCDEIRFFCDLPSDAEYEYEYVSALQHDNTFWDPEMCTAGQRVLRTITGPGPSYFKTKIYAGQRTQRGRCPIEQRGELPSVHGGQGLSKGWQGLEGGGWLEAWNKVARAWGGCLRARGRGCFQYAPCWCFGVV